MRVYISPDEYRAMHAQHDHSLPSSHRALNASIMYACPLLALMALAAIVRLHGQLVYPDPHALEGDNYRYIAMAQHPFGPQYLERDAPYCWRILVPLIVHTLPMPTLTGYWVLTVAGLMGATLSLIWFLRGLGLSAVSASAGALAFVVLGPATGFTLWDYMLIDPISLALFIAALGCAMHRRGLLLLLTLCILATAKEVVIFAAVFALLWATQRRDWAMVGWSAAGLACSGIILAAIRMLVATYSSYNLYAEMSGIYAPHASRLAGGSVTLHSIMLALGSVSQATVELRLLLATAGTWGVLLPVAALQLIHRSATWKSPAFVVLLVLATAQILVSFDVERVVVYGCPVVIAACAFELDYLAARFGVAPWFLWIPVWGSELVWWRYFAVGARHDLTAQLLVADRAAVVLACFVLVAWLAQPLRRLLRARLSETTTEVSG